MSSSWNPPDREPIASDPDLESLVRLYRDHPPSEPSEQAWQKTLTRTRLRLARRPTWPLIVGLLASAAAAVGGMVLARNLWSPTVIEQPPREQIVVDLDGDAPFEVATLGEIEIIGMDPSDADRIAVGQPVIGTMEFVMTEDFDLVKIESSPKVDCSPRLQRNVGVPMLIVANSPTDEEEP